MTDVPMSVGKAHLLLTVVPDPADGDRSVADSSASASLIGEIVHEGARRMLAEALKAEVDACIARFADERDELGRRLVMRNGSHQAREVLHCASPSTVETEPEVRLGHGSDQTQV
ncbi:hypothetical protein [Streptosporangium lutulentum]|uniref:Uncharacterized protein n=1 Tax=Streptosporangium lutulentum TaxID=1461250 RepID=A0ABT9QPG0_9ACTN|nr:hypothetical protein [Streptosporangium lutulentum]